ncbi:MAG: glycosyltransferase family 8 protein [Oscillospiraceae bacterium]
MEPINLLVTLDEAYLPPLRTMLKSMYMNNPGEEFHVYLIHGGISPEELSGLGDFCEYHRSRLYPVTVRDDLFADAPVFGHLTKAMYYRLLAHRLLPKGLDRILYLDPDILVINSLRELYETDLTGYLYAACIHTDVSGLTDRVNKIRLSTYETAGYFNSGVLLMNLEEQRKNIREQDIFQYVVDHRQELLLPDQDIINGLYGERIRSLDDSLYNYDAHRYEVYRMASLGEKDVA